MSWFAGLLSRSDAAYERKLWTLMVALLVMSVVYPLAVNLGIVRFYRLTLSAVLILAAYSVSGNRRVLRIATVLAIPTVFGQVLGTILALAPLTRIVVVAMALGFVLFVTLIIAASTFRSGEVTGDRIAGAICVYLLSGLFFAMLFGAIMLSDPAAFDLGSNPPDVYREGGEFAFLYFSFVTITTLGYGDVLPVSPAAQMVAWIEAVFGQLYIAILVARLVGLHIAHSRSRGRED
jgi:hypothetical protein